jgi:hypothetical protein
MVHHELAHIRRRHVKSSGTWSVEQEREADYEAADWILGPNPNLRDALFTKQMPGVSLALEALVVRNIYGGREEGITHPYSWDRIFNTLSRYIPDGGHPVYAFIIFTMKLHLDNAAVTTPQRVFTDFYECFNTYVEVLSRRDARSPGHA